MVHRLLAVSIDAHQTYPELLDKVKSEVMCDRLTNIDDSWN